MNVRRISLKLPDETYAKLRAYCHAEGKSLQGALRALVEAKVADVVAPEVKVEPSAEARAFANWRRFG